MQQGCASASKIAAKGFVSPGRLLFAAGRGVVKQMPDGGKPGGQDMPTRRSRRLCRLAAALLSATLLAPGCSDTPVSEQESSLAARSPSGAFTIERERMAREAFDRWAPLVTRGALDEARALCEAWLGAQDHGHHVEAHKCLANVTIATARTAREGMSAGVGSVPARISNEGVALALAHYEQALAKAPLDPDAHVGRVDLLILAGRYREANTTLDRSLGEFASREMLDHWFKLLGRFQRTGAIEEGLAYLQVIERHHPLDHRLASNLGAFYAMTGHDDEAQRQLERAITINPDDPINHWNLARFYDKHDRLEDADRHFQEALAVMNQDDVRARCDYAEFIATRIEDLERACRYAEKYCEELYQRNCGPGAEHAKTTSHPAT